MSAVESRHGSCGGRPTGDRASHPAPLRTSVTMSCPDTRNSRPWPTTHYWTEPRDFAVYVSHNEPTEVFNVQLQPPGASHRARRLWTRRLLTDETVTMQRVTVPYAESDDSFKLACLAPCCIDHFECAIVRIIRSLLANFLQCVFEDILNNPLRCRKGEF